MKSYKFILPILALGAFVASCDDDIETVKDQGKDVVAPTSYSELYYQNLREYKATDHEISFGWFSSYGGKSSMEARFASLPDSIDIVSLWGGIPSNPVDVKEMRDCQKNLGIKFTCVDICRINKVDENLPFKKHWLDLMDRIDNGEISGDEAQAEKEVVMQEMALKYVDEVFENDLDGYDLDFEPEGDPVQGRLFYVLMMEMAKYLGPNPDQTKEERYQLILERYGKAVADKEGSCDKLLCIDAYGQDPSTTRYMDAENGRYGYADYINWFFSQDYNGIISRGNYPANKVVHCMSVGEDWNNDPTSSSRSVGNYYTKQGRLYDWARWEPGNGEKKGGFGGFIINKDYTITSLNPWPYARFRDCIQICNPAIY